MENHAVKSTKVSCRVQSRQRGAALTQGPPALPAAAAVEERYWKTSGPLVGERVGQLEPVVRGAGGGALGPRPRLRGRRGRGGGRPAPHVVTQQPPGPLTRPRPRGRLRGWLESTSSVIAVTVWLVIEESWTGPACETLLTLSGGAPEADRPLVVVRGRGGRLRGGRGHLPGVRAGRVLPAAPGHLHRGGLGGDGDGGSSADLVRVPAPVADGDADAAPAPRHAGQRHTAGGRGPRPGRHQHRLGVVGHHLAQRHASIVFSLLFVWFWNGENVKICSV